MAKYGLQLTTTRGSLLAIDLSLLASSDMPHNTKE